MRVALTHDWLVSYRGGEKVLEALCELFPDADLFTLLHLPNSVPPLIEKRKITTSFLQHVPGIFKRYRHFLPLFPAAIESFDLREYDLIISSSHCVAKGILKPASALHLSYLHAPMRYIWDLFEDYFGGGKVSPVVRAGALLVRPFLQKWDVKSASRVDHFIANSQNIARKIELFYHRSSKVIYPPVTLDRLVQLNLAGNGQGGYFLWLGAFAPYKRLDLAIEAFARLGLPLWIGGSGQDSARYFPDRLPPNIKMLGQVSDAALPTLYRNARALIFTGDEDFGMTPVEAQASGRPVIAYAKGGALETVSDQTGIFFGQQSVDSLIEAIQSFDTWEKSFSPAAARQHALRFGREAFKMSMREEISKRLNGAEGKNVA